MNLNEQLQQAYESGRRQALNESLLGSLLKGVKGAIRGGARGANDVGHELMGGAYDLARHVRKPMGKKQWSAMLQRMGPVPGNVMGPLFKFLSNPTQANLNALNEVLAEFGIRLVDTHTGLSWQPLSGTYTEYFAQYGSPPTWFSEFYDAIRGIPTGGQFSPGDVVKNNPYG
tara:strand:+ start:44 stop:559 length:516 start_codon:yes stop_codon:yes gene_type:complete